MNFNYHDYLDTTVLVTAFSPSDEEIKTKDIFERINVMMKNSDCFIVLPGGTGTLLELAVCLEYINKGLSRPKPIIALGNFWKPIADRLSHEPVLNNEARVVLNSLSCGEFITFVNTIKEVLEKLTQIEA